MNKRTRRVAAVALVAAAAASLSACASSTDASVKITAWLDQQGASCGKTGTYDATTVSAVPFTRVICDGVEFDFFDSGAAERYDEFWSADCAATPVGQRTALDQVVVVRGPTWVLRGDAAASGSWPESLAGAAGVSPGEAAAALDGTELTLGQACRDLGAWST